MLMLCFKIRILQQTRKISTQVQTENPFDGSEAAAAVAAATATTTVQDNDNNDNDGDDGDVTEDKNILLTGFMNDLYQGLQMIIKSLANYSIAFEALQGMKGMLRLYYSCFL